MDNLSQIVSFFVSISSSYVDYYEEINRKIQSLERLRESLYKEEMYLRRQHNMTQDFELERLEERKTADLSKAEEKEKLLMNYENQLTAMHKFLDSCLEECTNYENQIKEDKQKLLVVNQFQNLVRITELIGKSKETQKKIDTESAIVLKAMSQRQIQLYGTISKRSKDIGFANVETYHKFKEELEKFQLRFQDFSSISKKYQNRMENYALHTQTHVKHFQNEINSEKSQALRNLIHERKLHMLLAKNPGLPNPDVSEVSLFELVEKYIPIEQKRFSLQELREVCKNENAIIDIICQIDQRAAERATSQYIGLFLRDLQMNLENLENSIADIEQTSFKFDEDAAFLDLKEQVTEMEQEKNDRLNDGEDKEEWANRQKELTKNINLKKIEMQNRKADLRKEENESTKKKKVKTEEKKKLEDDNKKIEFRYSNALSEVIGKLNYWLTYHIDGETRRVCVPALEYLNEQLLMLEGS